MQTIDHKESQASDPSMVVIRQGTMADKPDAMRIIEQYHQRMPFGNEPIAWQRFDMQFQHFILPAPNRLGVAAEINSKKIGFAAASLDPYPLADGIFIAAVKVIAIDLEIVPPLRAMAFISLIAAVRNWSKSVNARYCTVNVTTGFNSKASAKILKAAGATLIGGSYFL